MPDALELLLIRKLLKGNLLICHKMSNIRKWKSKLNTDKENSLYICTNIANISNLVNKSIEINSNLARNVHCFTVRTALSTAIVTASTHCLLHMKLMAVCTACFNVKFELKLESIPPRNHIESSLSEVTSICIKDITTIME